MGAFSRTSFIAQQLGLVVHAVVCHGPDSDCYNFVFLTICRYIIIFVVVVVGKCRNIREE